MTEPVKIRHQKVRGGRYGVCVSQGDNEVELIRNLTELRAETMAQTIRALLTSYGADIVIQHPEPAAQSK